ncbi:MAG: hypothetical protein U0Q11_26950 [Vicinamibacterales bacterium]
MGATTTSQTTASLWSGRRGVVNTVVCCALAVLCAFGVWSLAERLVIVPACSRYAQAHEMTYADFRLVGVRHASTVVCLLRTSNGGTHEVYLKELVSFVTDALVGFAMSLEITVPVCAIGLAAARVGIYRLTDGL